jgi:hypothetical protein
MIVYAARRAEIDHLTGPIDPPAGRLRIRSPTMVDRRA